MKTLVSFFTFFLAAFTSYAQEHFYYIDENTTVPLTERSGEYVVEFPNGVSNFEGFNGTHLFKDYYVFEDTTLLDSFAVSHIVRRIFDIEGVENPVYETGKIIVKFKEGVSQTDIDEIVEANQLQEVYTAAIFTLFSCENDIETANTIHESEFVEYAHPDFIHHIEKNTNDTYFDKQFYLHNTGQVINDGQSGTNDADIDAPEAWQITTGNPNVVVAVLDDGVPAYHPDLPLSRQVRVPRSNFVNPQTTVDNPEPSYIGSANAHGTACAGIIAAEHNTIGIAGIAPGCKIMPINMKDDYASTSSIVANSILFADSNNAQILSCSWSFGNFSTTTHTTIDNAIKHVINNNRIVIFSAGNTANNPKNGLSPAGKVLYPANSQIKGIITVGASDKNDKVALYSPRSPLIDIVAPSARSGSCNPPYDAFHDVWTTDLKYELGYNPWPYDSTVNPCFQNPNGIWERLPYYDSTHIDTLQQYFTGRFSGTSAAAPQVAATAALMMSVNSCMSNHQIKDILLQTADKVGGYYYNINKNRPGHSKEMGYGRLNAHKAVKAAQDSYSPTLDLYIKDSPDDLGLDTTYNTDNSPDIWVRMQPDGFTVQEHQNPDYSISQTAYVYVRVRNKSCVSSAGKDARVKLYWSKAATISSWPNHWNGSNPAIGDSIGVIYFGALEPGMDTVLEFTWQLPNVVGQWTACLLAHIFADYDSPFLHLNGNLHKDVGGSNNITLKNLTVLDPRFNLGADTPLLPRAYSYGGFLYIGNAKSEQVNTNLHLYVREYAQEDITQAAEVTLNFDSIGWAFMETTGAFEQEGVTVIRERILRIDEPNVILSDLTFPADLRIPVFLGINFYIDSLDETVEYEYRISQSLEDNTEELIGTQNFLIRKAPREDFEVDAGEDMLIDKNTSTTLQAASVNEPATYNWYDQNDSLIYTGQSMTISPQMKQKYKLEVISSADGFKGYDEVEIDVKKYFITAIVPNPANGQFVLHYDAEDASSAYIVISQTFGQVVNNYILSPAQTHETINISNYTPGLYNVTLICDGQVADTKTLLVN